MLNHIPSREKIAELVISVLENSNDLFDEAVLLFEHQKYTRLFTLSQIYLEELAKAKLFMDALYYTSQEYFIGCLEVAIGMKNSLRLIGNCFC